MSDRIDQVPTMSSSNDHEYFVYVLDSLVMSKIVQIIYNWICALCE